MGLPGNCHICVSSRWGILLVSAPFPCRLWGRLEVDDTDFEVPSSTIPEITDADMAFQAEETHANVEVGPFHKQYRLFHAAFAQFCYTGAQVRISTKVQLHILTKRPGCHRRLLHQLCH
jgi:hypothetical protein